MANIPSDVIWDILLHSPVKDLLRLRCVSKFFSSLIESRDFIKLHLSHSQETKTNLYGILIKDLIGQVKIFDITKYVKNDIVSSATVFSLPPVSNKLIAVGSCNGLIALLNRNSRGDDIDITIWNPFTGKSKKVGFSIPPTSELFYGFGYDSETDDYKLVKITAYWDSLSDRRVVYKTAVYSLKTHTWREIGKDWSLQYAYNPCLNEIGVVANNALHWTIHAPDDKNIVAFDLVKEEYYYIPTIEGWNHRHSFWLSVMDGCLTLTNDNYNDTTFVWIMKEYGVQESWTNLLYIRWPLKLSFCPYTRPLAYSRDWAKVLLYRSSRYLLWYDLSTKKVENSPFVLNDSGERGIITFVGSLVAVDKTTNAKANLKRKIEKEEKKEISRDCEGEFEAGL